MTLTRTLVLLSVFLPAAHSAIPVCLIDEQSLNPETIRYFEAGLKSHEKELGTVFQFDCDSLATDGITIRLRNFPAVGQPANALGCVRVRDGEVIGEVQIFAGVVRRELSTRWSPWASSIDKVTSGSISPKTAGRKPAMRSLISIKCRSSR